MVIAEAIDAVLRCERGLICASLRQPQVVKAEVGRQVRLVMTSEARTSLGNVCPFREALPPPFVVVGSWINCGKWNAISFVAISDVVIVAPVKILVCTEAK